MYCKYCGRKIDDDSTFCSGCGAKLNIALRQRPLPNPPVIKKPKAAIAEIEEDFDPTLENLLAQFTPAGKIIFILLCMLMVVWVASLTVYIFYPEFINIFAMF